MYVQSKYNTHIRFQIFLKNTGTNLPKITCRVVNNRNPLFGMTFCEYLSFKNQREKRSRRLCIRIFQLFKNNIKMAMIDKKTNLSRLITITFKLQKNGETLQTIIQHRALDNIFQIKCWGKIIPRL